MSLVYLLASLQSLFLVALLAAKKDKSLADLVLMAWLGGIGIHTGIYFLSMWFGLSVPLLMSLNAGFPFLQGPFLLAYVAAVIGLRSSYGGADWLHLVPFTLYCVYLAWTHGSGAFAVVAGEHSITVSLFSLSWFMTVFLFITVPVYIAWALVLMRSASKALDGSALPSRFRWIRFCIVGLGVVWLTTMINFTLIRSAGISTPPHLVFWALTLFVYGLGYLGLSQTSVFREPEMEVLRQSLQPKYKKSGLGPDETRALYADLKNFMDENRPWLDGGLSLQSLSEASGISANHLSQIINEVEKRSFRDFINARRVEAAKQQLVETPDANLLELGLACGFNSKSSFNRAFRKFVGQTPSDYASTV